MFNSVLEKLRSKAESGKIVTPAEALENKSVWNSRRLMDEISSYERLMAFMAVDRASGDGHVRDGSLDTIRKILKSDCGVTFASPEDLEKFVGDYILLTKE